MLTKYNGQAITYDKIGNPLQYRDGMSFSWANGRNLAQVTKNGAEITYSHDMDGRVIRKQVNDRVYEYVYDGSTLVAERVSYDLTEDIRIPITLQYLFDETGKRYGFRSSGMTYLYEFNGQGDVVALYNAGTKMAEYTYDAWGRVISVKSSSGQELPARRTSLILIPSGTEDITTTSIRDCTISRAGIMIRRLGGLSMQTL